IFQRDESFHTNEEGLWATAGSTRRKVLPGTMERWAGRLSAALSVCAAANGTQLRRIGKCEVDMKKRIRLLAIAEALLLALILGSTLVVSRVVLNFLGPLT